MKNRHELATIDFVVTSGPLGGKNLQLGFQTAEGNFTLSFSPIFSTRSNLGKAFQTVTGIKPDDFGGGDPLPLMVGQPCRLVLEPRDNEKRQRSTAILPPPSPQLELRFESTN